MDKIIKLNSRQGGPFTATQNLCDFDIPADGTYDLSESYINLFARIVGTASGATSTSIPNMDLGNDGGNGRAAAVTNLAVNWSAAPNRSFYNIAMVKNTSLTTEKVGVLEDIRRVDILRQILNEYTQSTPTRRKAWATKTCRAALGRLATGRASSTSCTARGQPTVSTTPPGSRSRCRSLSSSARWQSTPPCRWEDQDCTWN